MSVTDDKGDLVPLSSNVVEWVYGNAEYVGSVFGTTNPNRKQLAEYYEHAKSHWHRVSYNSPYRRQAYSWLRASGIKGLDYYWPIGFKEIWFKYLEDAFTFKLKFGDVDDSKQRH